MSDRSPFSALLLLLNQKHGLKRQPYVILQHCQAAHLAQAADPHGVLDELPGIASVEHLRATPPAEVHLPRELRGQIDEEHRERTVHHQQLGREYR